MANTVQKADLLPILERFRKETQGEIPPVVTSSLQAQLQPSSLKPIFIVHGKPGVGKTTHALKFAKLAGLDFVSFDSLLAPVTTSITDQQLQGPIAVEIRQQLTLGHEITAEQLYRLLEDRLLHTEDVLFKGR